MLQLAQFNVDEESIMSQVIRISNELYKRLEGLASGFDTPSNVIEMVLNAYEGVSFSKSSSHEINNITPSTKLEIIYFPNTEEAFKEKFLISKKAYIKFFYTNGETELKEWNSADFKGTSKVAGNLRSGYLRGWKEKGIVKAEVAIDRNDIT